MCMCMCMCICMCLFYMLQVVGASCQLRSRRSRLNLKMLGSIDETKVTEEMGSGEGQTENDDAGNDKEWRSSI